MKKRSQVKSRTASYKEVVKNVHQNGWKNNSYHHEDSDIASPASKDSKSSRLMEIAGGLGKNKWNSFMAAVVTSLMTLFLRVYYVTDRSNWVVVHPDEVFQSMEVAHTEHYGYGFRPYEFASPLDDVTNVTAYRQMELDAGLTAMRSPLFPYYYVIAAELTSFVGLDVNPYLMFRLAHVLVTSLLPMSVYFYCWSTFHQSRDVALLAALLTPCSLHLNVLGSHCFLQSFLSPLTFLTMGLVNSFVVEESESESETTNVRTTTRNSCVVEESESRESESDSPRRKTKTNVRTTTSRNSFVVESESESESDSPRRKTANVWTTTTRNPKHNNLLTYPNQRPSESESEPPFGLVHLNSDGKAKTIDKNNNNVARDFYQESPQRNIAERDKLSFDYRHQESTQNFPEHDKLSVNSDLMNPHIKSSYSYMPIVTADNDKHIIEYDVSRLVSKVGSSIAFKGVVIGCLIGVTCYIRPDVVLVHAVNMCFVMSSSSNHFRKITSQAPMILAGLTMAFLFGVMTDTRFYGGLTVTPWNWFVVNVVRNISTSVFGKMDFWFYFRTFYSRDTVMCGICVAAVMIYVIVIMFTISLRGKDEKDELQNRRIDVIKSSSPVRLFLLCISLLVIYSCHGHKEMRFIHDAIVFVIILSSSAICKTLQLLVHIDLIENKKIIKGVVAIAFVTIWSFQLHKFFNHSSTTQWTFQHAPDTQHSNACLEFISQQSDVSGVFLEDNIFSTGAMTILHKDVPIFSRVMSGFFEFDKISRTITTTTTTTTSRLGVFLNTGRRSLSMNTFTRVSNYASLGNSMAVLRSVLEKQEYNYYVVTNEKPFMKMGFRRVFETSHRKVLKRVGDSASEHQINHVINRLSVGTDVNVLIHEGDVLFHMNQHQRAAERFQQALNVPAHGTEDAIGAYLPLYDSLKQLGRQREGLDLMNQCCDRHGETRCWAPRRITRLHNG